MVVFHHLKVFMRTCKKCEITKPISDFYKHPNGLCGHDTKCKECAKLLIKAARNKNIDHYLAFDRARANRPDRVAMRKAYMQTDAGKNSHKKANKKYSENNPKRKAACMAVSNAIRSGLLKPLPCFVCGSTEQIEGHHPDYDSPLSVVWLCMPHHKEIHTDRK